MIPLPFLFLFYFLLKFDSLIIFKAILNVSDHFAVFNNKVNCSIETKLLN